jgi:hypothetical protein
MLLRLNAVFLRGSFAEIEEPPDLPAELGRIAMRIAGPAREIMKYYFRARE